MKYDQVEPTVLQPNQLSEETFTIFYELGGTASAAREFLKRITPYINSLATFCPIQTAVARVAAQAPTIRSVGRMAIQT